MLYNIQWSIQQPNYRPPTTNLGPDLPTTENIYNADPSQPKFNNWYKDSRSTGEQNKFILTIITSYIPYLTWKYCSGRYKQCLDKTKREECDCKDSDKLQGHPSYSDCIEKVSSSTGASFAHLYRRFTIKFLHPGFLVQAEWRVCYKTCVPGHNGPRVPESEVLLAQTSLLGSCGGGEWENGLQSNEWVACSTCCTVPSLQLDLHLHLMFSNISDL